LSYNIYSGGNRKRSKQIAEINETIANTETQEMVHLVSNQLLNEFDAYNIRKIQNEVATESLKTAELNLDISADKLKSGAINSFNYRDIQLLYLNAALQKVQAIYALIQSHTNLSRLTGGFVEEGYK
jgi:outer membrane protein TolC